MIRTIKTTQNHINKGSNYRGSRCCCPLALAAQEVFLPLGYSVSVITHLIYCYLITIPGTGRPLSYSLMLPDEVRKRVLDFDSGKGMQPFEFDVEIEDDNDYLYQ